MTTITAAELLQDPAALLRRIEAGEVLVIVRDGKPIADVTPKPEPRREPRPFGLLAGQFTVPDDFDDPLPPEIIDEFYK